MQIYFPRSDFQHSLYGQEGTAAEAFVQGDFATAVLQAVEDFFQGDFFHFAAENSGGERDEMFVRVLLFQLVDGVGFGGYDEIPLFGLRDMTEHSGCGIKEHIVRCEDFRG